MPNQQRKGGRPWRRIVAFVIARDSGLCQLRLPGCTTTATTGDHVIPVWQRPDLELDPENVKAACKHCNQAKSTRPENTTLRVILGPPCAGKTTHIANHRRPEDVVIDHDALAQALGYPHEHGTHGAAVQAARIARTAVIDAALDGKIHAATIWIIHTAPSTTHVRRYLDAGATIELIDPGQGTCLRRAEARPYWTRAAITDWYSNHAPMLRTLASGGTTIEPSREW